MPFLSDDNKVDLDKLRTNYHYLSWTKQLFFPSVLETNLSTDCQITIEHAWLICNSYLTKTWFFQRYFFSCLNEFERSCLVKGCRIFVAVGLLTSENALNNFNVLASSEEIFPLVEGLETLYKIGLLTYKMAPFYLTLLEKPETQSRLLKYIKRLNNYHLLKLPNGYDNFLFVASHPNPKLIDEVLNYVIARNFLKEEADFRALITQKDLEGMLHVFYFLDSSDCEVLKLTSKNEAGDIERQEVSRLVVRHPNPKELFFALESFSSHSKLDRSSTKEIASSINPKLKVAALLEKRALPIPQVPIPKIGSSIVSNTGSQQFFERSNCPPQVNLPMEDVTSDFTYERPLK